MRRAAAVALLALAATFVLGFLRAGDDIDDETQAAMQLATALAQLGQAAALNDAALTAAVAELQRRGGLRHLALTLVDAQGLVRASSSLAAVDGGAVGWLARLHAAWQGEGRSHRTMVPIARPDGSRWTLVLTDVRDSERREAMAELTLSMVALALGGLAMLGAMAWAVRRALRPLQGLLDGIERLERGEPDALHGMPVMPIGELQAVAQALRRLDAALLSAQAGRRVLRQKVLTLQEDERQRLARDLHDELGQRLTALRVDAAWLQRRLRDAPELQQVVQSMAAQCEQVQQDIRATLARLQPFGATVAAHARLPLAQLLPQLQPLLRAWSRGAQGWHLSFDAAAEDANGRAAPWPGDDAAGSLPMSTALAVYRLTQEALTNVARHAQATRARLLLRWRPEGGVDATRAEITWTLEDDGLGIADGAQAMQRGSGLAGMRERIWTQGGELTLQPLAPGAPRPGLRLSARFPIDLAPRDGAA